MENNSQPLVSIIILNYNAGQLLLDCVNSIKKSKVSGLSEKTEGIGSFNFIKSGLNPVSTVAATEILDK